MGAKIPNPKKQIPNKFQFSMTEIELAGNETFGFKSFDREGRINRFRNFV